MREKIFLAFFTTKPAGEGTGIVLSLSYDIVVKRQDFNAPWPLNHLVASSRDSALESDQLLLRRSFLVDLVSIVNLRVLPL